MKQRMSPSLSLNFQVIEEHPSGPGQLSPGLKGFLLSICRVKVSSKRRTGHSRDHTEAEEVLHKGPSFVSNCALFKARSDSASALLLAA